MKKILMFFCFSLVLLITACSNDDEISGDYHMRFQSNGTAVEYTNPIGLSAGFAQNGNQHVAAISGWNDANSNLILTIYSAEPFIAATYQGYTVATNGIAGVLFAYKDISSGAVYSSGATPQAEATVTITEITETGVKGKFSAKVTAAGQADIQIGEGTFFVKRVLN